MIAHDEIEKRFVDTGEVDYVHVGGDGYHYQLIVVSDLFINQTSVKRQQWVYAQLKDWIAEGRLHAVNMQTYTKDEWEKKSG